VLAHTATAQQQRTVAPIRPRRIQSQVRRRFGKGGSGGRLAIRQSGAVGGTSLGREGVVGGAGGGTNGGAAGGVSDGGGGG
jgi:hypothetical protein